jgi:hypothetical protein
MHVMGQGVNYIEHMADVGPPIGLLAYLAHVDFRRQGNRFV